MPTQTLPPPAPYPTLQGKDLAASERLAAQLDADLSTVRKERDGLTAQLAATAAQLEQTKQDLAAKAALLEEEQSAKVGPGVSSQACSAV